MNPQAELDGLQKKNRELSLKNEEYLKLIESAAEAKRQYRVAYAQKALSLKSGGMAITIIPSLAKGDPAVADLRYKMDVSDGVMKACKQAMEDIRTAIDSYRSRLAWLKVEYLENRS
jgi:rubrerythrin